MNAPAWPADNCARQLRQNLIMNKALRFLHLEDEPDYAALVQQTLEQAGLQAQRSW